MVVDVNEWKHIENIGEFQIKKQYIHPASSDLFGVFAWRRYETGVQTGVYEKKLKDQVTFWTLEEARGWAKANCS